MRPVSNGSITAMSDAARWWGGDYSRSLAFLSLFGERNAVLALWATVITPRKYLNLDGTHVGVPDGVKLIKLETPINRSLLHVVLIHPEGTNQSSMFSPSFIQLGDDSPQKFFRRLSRACAVPMRSTWSEWLWNAGFFGGLIEGLQGYGPEGYRIKTAAQSWAALIKQGLESGEIR